MSALVRIIATENEIAEVEVKGDPAEIVAIFTALFRHDPRLLVACLAAAANAAPADKDLKN